MPEDTTTAESAWNAIQTCREVYNHALTQEYRPAPDHNKPSYNTMQNMLPKWKREWSEWKGVYSKCLQMAVRRIKNSESVLDSLEERGFDVGRLKWKSPREYRSIKYNQSGFDVDNNTGQDGHAIVNLSKIGNFNLDYHRPLPTKQNQNAKITEVILKKQKTGDWTVSIVVKYDADYPEKPTVENISIEDTVGIDLGITKFIHDSDNRAFARLDEEKDRERVERRHRSLSRKQYESENWNKARQSLVRAYERLRNRREDYREKLACWYTQEYDAVFLEDLDVASMTQQDRNARNISAMSWYATIQAFERHGNKNGCHIVKVPPEGTTKRCAKCGVGSDKPLWVREHSCPSCGFTVDRDYNSSLEVQQLGLKKLGVEFEKEELGLGQSEYSSNTMSVEAGISEGSHHRDALLSNTAVNLAIEAENLMREHRSPTLKERTAKAVSE
ncbi:MAG: transposase, IS605 OrfB family, central region [Haloquadratum walsbyi J07HQW2]|uniref:Transposase, IS605 OrfB family, central region n=1 Tax=Haloquadratum walsbyi J07HQW2 TaxID=1238425 RepID=U1NC75_9EURY|nr:MAG: transposase, IS605 OrfB family, central region [Haloquadratum walsbyi J07HQW2]